MSDDGKFEWALASGMLGLARGRGVAHLDAVLKLDGERYHVTVERDLATVEPDDDGGIHEEWHEHVIVKAGPQTRPRIVLAGPARLIERVYDEWTR